jgi:hypothetical protein
LYQKKSIGSEGGCYDPSSTSLDQYYLDIKPENSKILSDIPKELPRYKQFHILMNNAFKTRTQTDYIPVGKANIQ